MIKKKEDASKERSKLFQSKARKKLPFRIIASQIEPRAIKGQKGKITDTTLNPYDKKSEDNKRSSKGFQDFKMIN